MTVPTSEEIRSALLERARRYCERANLSFSTVGMKSVNDSKFLARIESGANFNVATYQRVNDWLDQAELDLAQREAENAA